MGPGELTMLHFVLMIINLAYPPNEIPTQITGALGNLPLMTETT